MSAPLPGPRRPACTHCGTAAMLVAGRAIYPDRPDLAEKPIWQCPACPDAYVGCHPGTDHALGTPADRELRRARRLTHELLDPLWKNAPETGGYGDLDDRQRLGIRHLARHRTYSFLAARLGIEREACHIAWFDIATCRKAYRELLATSYREIRTWAQHGDNKTRNKSKRKDKADA